MRPASTSPSPSPWRRPSCLTLSMCVAINLCSVRRFALIARAVLANVCVCVRERERERERERGREGGKSEREGGRYKGK